ncbi:MAG: aminopeptidase [Verrucomicrobia bacterium]|jgi:aminopeptidase|nr:aminopeptidase [Verrucomicrobiota bacterium]
MNDSRFEALAKNLVGYSVSLKRGERVLIDAQNVPDEIVVALIREVRARKGIPHVAVQHARITRELLMGATEEQYRFQAKIELQRMKGMDAYIALRGSDNIFESSDVPSKRMRLAMGEMRPVQNYRVKNTKWVVLRWPTSAMAQQSLTSTEAFEDFYFRVCCMDYRRMLAGQRALKRLMDRTDKVHIRGPGTDLRFSIKGLEAVMCCGEHNIPDGETFTAPVRESVEGELTYNVPSVYQGVSYDNLRFEFEKGKIVKASCTGDNRRLKAVLDSDPGARYIGEFAIGFNPYILEPMRDTLFDEKIAGSFHFTPGQAYEGEADNGNRSQVHWDIVNIQRKEYGGGEIRFDGKLIRKDGLFVPKALQKLNPDYLTDA